MKIILGARGSGKTTELIKQAAAGFIYIAVANFSRAAEVADLAKKLDLDIPYPITYSEVLRPEIRFRMQTVMIDNLEHFLSVAVPLQIRAVTLCESEMQFCYKEKTMRKK